jgi:predicted RNase H-like nuclease
MWVAGVDGCRAGWLAVFRPLDGQESRARILSSLVDVFSAPELPAIVAVDIPIGLPKISRRGGRAADVECRKILGRDRQSSIFPPPSRAALGAASFLEACKIELTNSTPPKKMNQQTFNIFGKIREADAIAHLFQGRIFECHPEVSFWAMNGGLAMQLAKKVSRRKNPDGINQSGLEERRQLLARNGFSEAFLSARLGLAKECGPDDLLDACVAAWTAARIFKAQAIRFPATAESDEQGVDMAIWA